VFTYII